ncbi:GxxExxY protein [candidate division TA06 bacterium]|uniref:GxxExxY protein n=1 Tax=candidate division TA06 bacterium TaxID=2250710 RepID=A0A933IC60_UNCT6|nr:GxxExxY protein [candidate division TA06 bacterium]
MNDKEIFGLCDTIRQTSFELHKFLRNGHLEKVYENGLTHRLRKAGLKVEQQSPLKVYDEDGTVLGEYFADLLIESELIIEMKVCKAIADEHLAQLLGYLRATGHRHGLLINFGTEKIQIKKLVL